MDGITKYTRTKLAHQLQVTPLKNEIIRLTSENNHLHQDIVKLADERDAKDSHSDFASRKLESQLSDLRFMVSQYATRVEVEQLRADESRDRAESLMGKLGLFQQMKGEKAVSTAEKLFQRLQKIDVETGLGGSLALFVITIFSSCRHRAIGTKSNILFSS